MPTPTVAGERDCQATEGLIAAATGLQGSQLRGGPPGGLLVCRVGHFPVTIPYPTGRSGRIRIG